MWAQQGDFFTILKTGRFRQPDGYLGGTEMKFGNTVAILSLACATLAIGATVASAANIAVVGGKTDDEFWNKIKKGLDDAGLVVKANGGKVAYLQLQSYD